MKELSFLETDSESIYDSVVLALENEVSEPLYPGDERRIFGDALAAVLVAAFNQVNDACKQKMLQFASGEVLDALGARYDCDRIAPIPAKTTLRFAIKDIVNFNIVINKGTRVTPDNVVYFQTVENAVLEAGSLFVEVAAECVSAGKANNGYIPGTINQIVDLVPYIDSVENTVTSYDGDDGEPYPEEDGGIGDDHYRARIRLAPTSLSVAGPRDAYEYYALSADSNIADVAILSDVQTLIKSCKVTDGKIIIGGYGYKAGTVKISGYSEGTDYEVVYEDELLIITLKNPTLAAESSVTVKVDRDMAGHVLIVPIMANGAIPDEEVLQKVRDVCSADDVRPMTDMVTVQAPEQVTYDIDITYYVSPNNESECIKTIEDAGGSIDTYITWQDTRMGRAINPDKLRALCLSPKLGTGCDRIVINKPTLKELKNTQVAKYSGNLKVTHVLIEEED